MKLLAKLFFTFLPLLAIAQFPTKRSHTIDPKIALNFLTPDSLSRQLTSGYSTDREKVASIFRWITENISYNVRPSYNATHNPTLIYGFDDDDDTTALKPLSERVAMDVLNRRIAFCDGYARLFQTLCSYAGIPSEVITGYANSNMGRGRFGSNHRWNAVYIDSSWQLLDATWASGHLTYSTDDFIQHYNNYYFLTPAKDFARDHYPEDLHWTLLAEPPYLSEFKFSPFKTHGYSKNNIRSYYPTSGIVEAEVGDTLHFEIETLGEKKNMLVLDEPFVDSATIAKATTDIFKNTSVVDGNKIRYTYIVNSPADKWLNIILNDELAMRYKLSIRNKMETANKSFTGN